MNTRSLFPFLVAAVALGPSLSLHAENPPALPVALQNSTYDIPSYGPVTLNEGRYRDETQGLTFVLDEMLFGVGDLDNDGQRDAAAILTVTPDGETEPFTYVAAVTDVENSPRPLTTAFVGRKLRVNALAIDGRKVMVELLFFKSGDPACCPSELLVQAYRVNTAEGRLEIASLAEGGLDDEDRIEPYQIEVDANSGSSDPNRGDRNFRTEGGIRFPL